MVAAEGRVARRLRHLAAEAVLAFLAQAGTDQLGLAGLRAQTAVSLGRQHRGACRQTLAAAAGLGQLLRRGRLAARLLWAAAAADQGASKRQRLHMETGEQGGSLARPVLMAPMALLQEDLMEAAPLLDLLVQAAEAAARAPLRRGLAVQAASPEAVLVAAARPSREDWRRWAV